MRSGTLPTHQIVGMGEAFRIAREEMATENVRIPVVPGSTGPAPPDDNRVSTTRAGVTAVKTIPTGAGVKGALGADSAPTPAALTARSFTR